MQTLQANPVKTARMSKTLRLAKRYSALTPEKRDVKLERFVESDNGHSMEVIHGQIVEKPDIGAIASVVCNKLAYYLTDYVLKRKNGYIISSEATYKCFSISKLTIRKPDISFVKKDRFADGIIPDGSILIPPDLAVEVVSKYDVIGYLENKLEDYRQAGVLEIWIVVPTTRIVLVCKAGSNTRVSFDRKSILTSPDILPGFSLNVGDIFE